MGVAHGYRQLLPHRRMPRSKMVLSGGPSDFTPGVVNAMARDEQDDTCANEVEAIHQNQLPRRALRSAIGKKAALEPPMSFRIVEMAVRDVRAERDRRQTLALSML